MQGGEERPRADTYQIEAEVNRLRAQYGPIAFRFHCGYFYTTVYTHILSKVFSRVPLWC